MHPSSPRFLNPTAHLTTCALTGLFVAASIFVADLRAEGGLTPDILENLRQSYRRDETRFNALAANPIDTLC